MGARGGAWGEATQQGDVLGLTTRQVRGLGARTSGARQTRLRRPGEPDAVCCAQAARAGARGLLGCKKDKAELTMYRPSFENPAGTGVWQRLNLRRQSADVNTPAAGDDARAARLSDVALRLQTNGTSQGDVDASRRPSTTAAAALRRSQHRSRPRRVPEGFTGLHDPLAWLRTQHVHESSDLPPFDFVVFLFQSLVHVLFPWSLPLYFLVAFFWLPKGFALQAVRVQGFLPLDWGAVPRTLLVEWAMPLVCQVSDLECHRRPTVLSFPSPPVPPRRGRSRVLPSLAWRGHGWPDPLKHAPPCLPPPFRHRLESSLRFSGRHPLLAGTKPSSRSSSSRRTAAA